MLHFQKRIKTNAMYSVSTHNWVNGPKIALAAQESGWQAAAAERVKPVEDNIAANRLVRLCDKVFPIAMWLDPWAKKLLVHNITIQSNWIIHMQICKWETPKTRIRGNKTAFLFFPFGRTLHIKHYLASYFPHVHTQSSSSAVCNAFVAAVGAKTYRWENMRSARQK